MEFDDLSRRFGELQALDHLTFTVPQGEVFGFLGPNGAGKTTAMRAIFGLVSLDAGAVRWKGAEVSATERRRFGYLPEERGLYPGMVVFDQLLYLARLHDMSSSDAKARQHPLARAPRDSQPQPGQDRVAVARQPATGAAGGRNGPRT